MGSLRPVGRRLRGTEEGTSKGPLRDVTGLSFTILTQNRTVQTKFVEVVKGHRLPVQHSSHVYLLQLP